MVSITGHAILKIMKGIQKVPNDSNSAEQGLDEVDFLEGGFNLTEYDMQLPGLKSSAVWADSPLSDGRSLISGALGNVTETIRCELTAGTIIQLAAMLSKLLRFKQDCNDFWDTFGQIEPVYLKHQVDGEPGPRYALLYDIDIDIDEPLTPGTPTRTVTLSIEREFGWRGLAPGDNPKRWTIENVMVGQKWDSSKAALGVGGDHLLFQSIQNRREWNTSGTAVISQNHVEIPAASIPGDLDALCSLSVVLTGEGALGSSVLYMGRSSKPDLRLDSGNIRTPNYILNGCDGAMGTDAATAADTGAPRIGSGAGANTRVNCTFATVTTDAARVRWQSNSVGYFDFSSNRGRFAVLLRARLSAAGTVTLHLGLSSGVVNLTDYLVATLTEQGTGGTGNTTAWGVAYLGIISVPPSDNPIITGADGLGISVDTSGTWSLSLYAARTSGTPTLYISDLIFIPIDEASGGINLGSTAGLYRFDNTGYTLHGKPGDAVQLGALITAALQGQGITLKPKTANRLYFFETGNGGLAQLVTTLTVRVNIVPRWSGLRDA